MINLAEDRHDLAVELQKIEAPQRAEIHEYIPPSWDPLPLACITAGDPWTEDGDVYGSKRVRWDIVLVVDAGDNEDAERQLQLFVQNTMQVLEDARYGVQRVGQPGLFQVNQSTPMLAVIITATYITN